MELHSVFFVGVHPRPYPRLGRVLRHSVAKNSPGTPLTVHAIKDTDQDVTGAAREMCKPTWLDNARKAKHHNAIVQAASEGEVLGFIDLDMMVLGDLSPLAELDFDIAYTSQPPSSQLWKVNSGLYLVRVSERTKAFLSHWRWICERLLGSDVEHEYWRLKRWYGGIHQAAFGCLIETVKHDCKLLELPCAIWNCCSEWHKAEKPQVVHIMAGLRDWCLNPGVRRDNRTEQHFVEQWRELEQEAIDAGVPIH